MPFLMWAYLNMAKQSSKVLCHLCIGMSGGKCHFAAGQCGVNVAYGIYITLCKIYEKELMGKKSYNLLQNLKLQSLNIHLTSR